LPIGIADVAERVAEAPQKDLRVWIASEQDTDGRHLCRLRAHGERPRDRGATSQCDKLASSHSITSSARAISVGGTVRPRAFAVLRLMTSSNLVGCWTGKSAGFSPLRTL